MAINYWRGPGAGGDPIQGGDFSNRLNWSRRSVPDASTSAVLGKGDYIVTCSAFARLAALSIGKGATFTVSGAGAGLVLLGASTNNGTLVLNDAPGAIETTLINTGTIAGRVLNNAHRLAGGMIENHGVLTTLSGGSGSVYLIGSAIDNAANGTIKGGSLALVLLGSVTNAGLVAADDAPVYFFSDGEHASLANLSNTILTGGDWRASGTGSIFLFGTKLTGLGAGTTVVLDGQIAHLAVSDGQNQTFVEDTLTRIDAGASLQLLGGHDFGNRQDFDLHGDLSLLGGTMNLRSFDTFAGSTLTAIGKITGTAHLEGSATVRIAMLTFTGDVTLDGDISGNGTLALAGASNKLLADSSVSVGTLLLQGGNTQLGGGEFHVGALTVEDASLDLGRQAVKLTGLIDLDDGVVRGSATLRLAEVVSDGASGFNVNVANTGSITVSGGTLSFDRALSGKGVVSIADGATLDFGAAATVAKTQTIHFDGAGTVAIAAPKQFLASLSGFGDGATVELTGFDADTAKLRWKGDADGSGGTLKVTDQGETTTLHFADGHYDRSGFETFQFGDGVLGITYTGAAGAVAPHGPVFGADAPAFATLHSMSDLPIGLIAFA